MIISHKHKFIFLHNPKAAGSSITVSLARYYGPYDIQIGSIGEVLNEGIPLNRGSYLSLVHKRNKYGYVCIRSFLGHLFREQIGFVPAFRSALDQTMKNRWRKDFGLRTAHPDAKEVKKIFAKEWQEYTKFCVVRNPWDQAVSNYFWRTKHSHKKILFEDFVVSYYSRYLRDDESVWDVRNITRIDNKIAVDEVISYENLHNDLLRVCNIVGLSWDEWLPHKKGKLRPKVDYTDLHTPKTREIIGAVFKQDIDDFGYTFDNLDTRS